MDDPTLTPTVGRTFIELHPTTTHEISSRRIILFIEQSQFFASLNNRVERVPLRHIIKIGFVSSL